MAETKKPIDTEEQVAAPAETAPKKWKLDLGSLFFNNRFVFFFSFVLSLLTVFKLLFFCFLHLLLLTSFIIPY